MPIDLEEHPRRCPDRSIYSVNRCEPFIFNTRGVLMHRVRFCKIHTCLYDTIGHCHFSFEYWCGNCTTSEHCELYDHPPENRVLCERCEAMAVSHGQPPADELAGYHVHKGRARVFKTCCSEEEN